ncbi:MAG TPA: NAD-dependent epimerase/dehydratase family protein [Acetobacteraceae bacterium]|nr:NAD-dependent epimerase/dehydratase family protein [Acetobacteraceae bacterium]
MQVSILGAGGFLGRRIADHLAREGRLGEAALSGMTLFDLAAPPVPAAGFPVRAVAGDVADLPEAAIPPGTDVVFHLAAVVSAAAEADYDLGWRVNLGGAQAVVAACRRLARPPRVVFTSSVASFSGGQDAVLADDARQVPANSYGAQKAAAELLLADASRRGMLDLVSIRLPTVVIRPGRPNKAASSFVSSILREPLLGLPAELPVPPDFAVWIASPRRAVEWLLHAAAMDTGPMHLDRGVNPPGISVTVAHMLQALDAVRPGASALIRHVPDDAVRRVVETWPASFEAMHARTLGFAAHEPVIDLVRAFVADDLEATRADRRL